MQHERYVGSRERESFLYINKVIVKCIKDDLEFYWKVLGLSTFNLHRKFKVRMCVYVCAHVCVCVHIYLY